MNAPLQTPSAVRTACPYCGVGCGVLARPLENGRAGIAGDPDHPANSGRLCSKGFALGETLALDGRLLYPLLRRSDGGYRRASWDATTTRVADGFQRVLNQHGPQAIAFYLSGQLLTEDYYVANKLAKGFVGTSNVDTNSRLCMASTVAGYRRAFGADVVPGCYEDLDLADLIVLVGSNTAWCHPVLYRRIVDSRDRRGTRIVVIDPRRTVTGAEADLFLPIAPGADTALFCGLLVYLAEHGAVDRAYIDAQTSGFSDTLARAAEIAPTPRAAAAATGLAEREVLRFFDLFLETSRTVTCFSQGVNQSAQGTDKVNVIINCHLATGRIGKAGMGPLSLTGQPNAMGGREVGGLANQLAAHMAFTLPDIDRVRRFWNAPRVAAQEGLKAVQMFEAIERGEIKALWVMATNPAVSLPRAGATRDALKKLDLFVVSENVAHNDTLAAAPHVMLPAAAWGEKDGTVTNSERRISRQRAFLPRPGETRPDWRIVCDVAKRLGFGEAFAFRSAADVFREHAALSGFENDGTRGFDIGALAAITDAQYDALDPLQWPQHKDEKPSGQRLFATGKFFTADRKARFVPPALPALREQTSTSFPLRLNTGRVRDQWHTMTRTGASPTLGAHRPEPFVEVHPQDARKHGLTPGGFARVRTSQGSCALRVIVSEDQQRGSLFAPIHWSDTNASSARIGDLVAPLTDPFSGQPESKATPAAVEPVRFAWRGLLLSRSPIVLPDGTWWARTATTDAMVMTFATNDDAATWRARTPSLFPDAVLTEYADPRGGIYRAAAFSGERLCGVLFVGPADAPPHWSDLRHMAEQPGIAATGPVLCACFGVAPADAATSGRAGRRCGSCLPELRQLATRPQEESRHEAAHAG